MSNVINKETLQYLKSVSTPEYKDGKWIINPVLPECEKKYWKVVGDAVKEMTAPEKKTIDDASAATVKESEKETLIMEKMYLVSRAAAIKALKDDGVLDSNGEIIGG